MSFCSQLSSSELDNTDSDPDFFINGIDSSLAVSDIDDAVYQAIDLGKSVCSSHNNLVSSNILAYDTDDNIYNSNDSQPNQIDPFINVIEASSNEDENIVENERKGKRSRRVSSQNRNKAKNARALGLKYISRSGKIIEKRKPSRPCTCKYKCFSKIPEEDRTTQFNIFNNIAQKGKQDT